MYQNKDNFQNMHIYSQSYFFDINGYKIADVLQRILSTGLTLWSYWNIHSWQDFLKTTFMWVAQWLNCHVTQPSLSLF